MRSMQRLLSAAVAVAAFSGFADGNWATIRQASPTGLRIGDRVRVTDKGVELLR